MHYLGIAGMMRRIYDPNTYDYLKPLQPVNTFITISAFILGAAQFIFLVNYFWSMFKGKKVETENPWESNGLEWSTPIAARSLGILANPATLFQMSV